MTGVYDSGMGGRFALGFLRELLPGESFSFFADTENAPYGTKTEKELVGIVKSALTALLSSCDRALIACCTASTVYHKLPAAIRARTLPIIEPTAERARDLTREGKIAILATEATVRSHAFAMALTGTEVIEIPAQKMVEAVERARGTPGGAALDYLEERLLFAAEWGADVIVLGCTHFSAYENAAREIIDRKIKKRISVVNSARVGALSAAERFFGRV